MENTYGISTGSLIWALASHQVSRIHWQKGLVPDAPPRLDTGVLEDSTGFAPVRELSGELGVKDAASQL